MPYGIPLYGIFCGHILLQIGGVGVVRIVSKGSGKREGLEHLTKKTTAKREF